MSLINILYNGVNVFSGLKQPCPFVGRVKNEIEEGERWTAQETIILQGQLTGCLYTDLLTAQTGLLNAFSQDFQTFQIYQGDPFNNGYRAVYESPVYIDSINFPENKYVKILPYTVTLKTYPSGYFSGYYGVLEPKNEWEFKEAQDGTVNITHTISARGLNTTGTNSNALQNATNYVLQYTGLSSMISPIFIVSGLSGILVEQNEKIDRFRGVYSVVENYIGDIYNVCQYGVLRYSASLQQPQAGFNQGKIQGSLRGGFKDNFNLVRSRFSGFNPFSNVMFLANSGINFNPVPLTQQISEDQFNKTITFDYTFDDNPFSGVNVAYDTNIESGLNIITTVLKGNINGRGDLNTRYTNVQSYFQNQFSPYQIASAGYFAYAGTGFILGPNPISESLSFDSFNGAISFSYTYNNEEQPLNNILEKVDYSISNTPPLRKIIANTLLATGFVGQPSYQTLDLGFIKRGSFEINGEVYPKSQFSGVSVAFMKNLINSIFINYTSGYNNIFLEKYQIDSDRKTNLKFSTRWSYASGDLLGNTGNYTSLINF